MRSVDERRICRDRGYGDSNIHQIAPTRIRRVSTVSESVAEFPTLSDWSHPKGGEASECLKDGSVFQVRRGKRSSKEGTWIVRLQHGLRI